MEQEKPNHRIKIVPLRNRPGLCGPAAAWFSGKWGIPEAEYRRSMEGMLQKNAAVPRVRRLPEPHLSPTHSKGALSTDRKNTQRFLETQRQRS